jgi:hypothetical protein
MNFSVESPLIKIQLFSAVWHYSVRGPGLLIVLILGDMEVLETLGPRI